jgi:hypothetical protein
MCCHSAVPSPIEMAMTCRLRQTLEVRLHYLKLAEYHTVRGRGTTTLHLPSFCPVLISVLGDDIIHERETF